MNPILTFATRACRWALLFACTGLAACSVESTFRPLSGIPEWRAELPAPDPVVAEPGTLAVRSFCPTLDKIGATDEIGDRLAAQAAKSAVGPMHQVSDATRKPHYEIVLTEAGEDGKFAGNKGAAVLSGVGTGVAAALLTRNRLAAVGGGFLGAVLAYVGLGKKEDVLLFRVECHQYTSSEGSARLSNDASVITLEGAGITDSEMDHAVQQQEAQKTVDATYFDVKSNRLCWVKFFAVKTKAGGFASDAALRQSLKDEILAQFPSYVFGGKRLY